MQLKINKLAEEMTDEAIKIRRELHKRAELSFHEHKTAEFVTDYLRKIGLKVKTGVAGTGVLGYLDAGKDNTVLMRADMDALPVEEMHDYEYKSENKGVMHACGHDVHMAVVLCCAKLLNSIRYELSSNVLFLFQPGEETEGGAELMINAGILEEYNITEAIGIHVMNSVEVGKILLKKGPVMASPDDFDLFIYGKGGHGAYPHECIDPIALSAKIISDFDMIGARFISPFAQKVISVCSINGGTANNVIPDTVHMSGTVRSYDEKIRKLLPEMMRKAIAYTCDAFGAKYDFEYNFRYPPLINDDSAVDKMYNAALNVLSEDCIIIGNEPSMAGDDFAYFAKKVPSVYFYLGSGNEKRGITQPLHSKNFDIDEGCLSVGISVMASYVVS